MKIRLKTLSIGLPALLLAVTLVSVTPANAVESETSTTTTTSTTTESDKTTTKHQHRSSKSEATDKRTTRQLAQKDEVRIKKCEGKRVGVQKRFTNIVNKSQKIQDKVTTIYGRGTTFVTTNSLAPANYDTLVDAADAAKLRAQTSIEALEAATPAIDCTVTDQTTTVAGFKSASVQVKDDLKAYRTAVKAVFVSIRAAAESAKTDSDTNDDPATTPGTPDDATGGTQ